MSKSLEQVKQDISPYYFSNEAIAREAYAQWEKEGRPDGNKLVSWCTSEHPMTIAQYHWWSAQMRLDACFDIDSDTIWVFESMSTKDKK